MLELRYMHISSKVNESSFKNFKLSMQSLPMPTLLIV